MTQVKKYWSVSVETTVAHLPGYRDHAPVRCERCFGTLQDRLVKSLRLGGVKTLEEANRHLEEEFLPRWKERFTRKPAVAVDAHRPLEAGQDLASILSHVETRQVGVRRPGSARAARRSRSRGCARRRAGAA